MTLAYDGSGFRGFAPQPGQTTVAGALVEAVAKVTGAEVTVVCAGRTDAGVHAWGQVIHFDVPDPVPRGRPLDVTALARSVNKLMAPAVVVRGAALAPEGFHARYSALARSYRYTVVNQAVPNPFRAATAWHLETPLDLRSLRAGCDAILGEHDFSSFCRRPPDRPLATNLPLATELVRASLVRRVLDAGWEEEAPGIYVFSIRASSFCHQMVRSLVGTLVEMGTGRRRAGDMSWVLASKDRSQAASPAPPHGLCLWSVTYPPGLPSPEMSGEASVGQP